MDHIWFLAMVIGDVKINNSKKYTSNAGNFDCHADVAVRCGLNCPMDHIPGFTRSQWQWMPPSDKCLRRIALAAAVVNEFFENTKH